MKQIPNEYLLDILIRLKKWALTDDGPPKDPWEQGYDSAKQFVNMNIPTLEDKKKNDRH